SVLAGYFYTAGPVRYGRRGLGEVVVFIFMGPLMVLASYYVQVEHLSSEAWVASIPVGLLVANILQANNLRDIANDRARSKVTIATMVGRPAADYILYALVLGAFASVIAGVATTVLPVECLLVALSVSAALATFAVLKQTEAAALNQLVRN